MTRNLKRSFIGLALLVAVQFSLSSCGYNTMVGKRETVDKQWAQVENVYQSRLDLIPNIVRTVERAANFEKETYTAVTRARAGLDPALADARTEMQSTNTDNNDEERVAKFQNAQEKAAGAAQRYINIVVENYPNLKSNMNFMGLQEQLEGAEARIRVERNKYNEVVGDYNTTIRTFPRNLTAGMFGFKSKGYFKAAAGADQAPNVNDMFNENQPK